MEKGEKDFKIQFSSFTKEENFWLNEQHSNYSQVKLKLKASFFRDLFLTLFNLVDYKKPMRNISKCVIEKLVIFLSNAKEFQALSIDQKQTVITRNVCFATSLIAITADWIQDGQDQLIFFRKLLTDFSGTDIILEYAKPERFTLKKVHQNIQPIFHSEEQELQIDQIMQNLQILDSLSISDLDTHTIALLFHTESYDKMPSMDSYRNFLLRTLQSKVELKFDANKLYHKLLNDAITFSTIQVFENYFNLGITSVMKELFDY